MIVLYTIIFLAILMFAVLAIPLTGNRRHKQYISNVRSRGPFSFPESFLWGSGVSAHQVEAQQPSDWTDYEEWVAQMNYCERYAAGHAMAKNIYRLSDYPKTVRKTKAAFEANFKLDLSMAKDFQLNSFRFSFSWARLFPKASMSRPDRSAVNYYRSLIRALKKNDINPVATLVFNETPKWFWEEKRGKRGWERDDALVHFETYVKAVANLFIADIHYWCTINSPISYVINGYFEAIAPPLEQRQSEEMLATIISRLMKAHALAYQILKKKAIEKSKQCSIGLVIEGRCFEPVRNYIYADRLAAQAIEQFYIWDFLDALKRGRLKIDYLDYSEEIPGIIGSIDFVGMYYHGRTLVQSKPFNPKLATFRPDEEGDLIYPHGLYKILRKLKDRYDLPIIVLQSSIHDAEMTDLKRQKFMITHLKEIWNALSIGVNIQGYFYHPFLDSFEWADGFEEKKGLVAVDFKRQNKRTPRKSTDLYTRIISQNAISNDQWMWAQE